MPWLGQYLAVINFCFFQVEAESSSSLQTLHLSVDLMSRGRTESSISLTEGVDAPDTSACVVGEFRNVMIESLSICD